MGRSKSLSFDQPNSWLTGIPLHHSVTSGAKAVPSHSGKLAEKLTPNHRTDFPLHAIQQLVSPYTAEKLPGRALQRRSFRFLSSDFPASASGKRRRVVPPSSSRMQGRLECPGRASSLRYLSSYLYL